MQNAREAAREANSRMLALMDKNPISREATKAATKLRAELSRLADLGTDPGQLDKVKTAALEGLRLDVLESTVHRRDELAKVLENARAAFQADHKRNRADQADSLASYRDKVGAMTAGELVTEAKRFMESGRMPETPQHADILSGALRSVDPDAHAELRKALTDARYDQPWLSVPVAALADKELRFLAQIETGSIPIEEDGTFVAVSPADILEMVEEVGA